MIEKRKPNERVGKVIKVEKPTPSQVYVYLDNGRNFVFLGGKIPDFKVGDLVTDDGEIISLSDPI